jgi:hypothetical protein
MALGDLGCGARESGCTNGTVVLRTALLVLSGVGQLGGTLAVLEGLFLKTGSTSPTTGTAWSPRDGGASVASSSLSSPSWTAVPMLRSNGVTLDVVGQF